MLKEHYAHVTVEDYAEQFELMVEHNAMEDRKKEGYF